VDTLLVTVVPYKFPVRQIYTGVTYVTLNDSRQSLGTNWEEEYKILMFSAYYEISKFTGDQSEW